MGLVHLCMGAGLGAQTKGEQLVLPSDLGLPGAAVAWLHWPSGAISGVGAHRTGLKFQPRMHSSGHVLVAKDLVS